MQHARLTYVSFEDYLAYEQRSDTKHEYVAGQIYAMVGTTDRHNLIALNIAAYLRAKLRGGPCRVFMSDVKVRIEVANAGYYPDVFVTCDGRDLDPYVKYHPCLVVEVLSHSTEGTDRREKLLNYRQLDSLQEYLLVDSDRQWIEVYRRETDGGWTVDTSSGDEVLELSSVGCSLPLAEVYAEVSIPIA
ncbi:MAG: Uma2 family endonuclease [Candidatus Competibacteraceae bacterium]